MSFGRFLGLFCWACILTATSVLLTAAGAFGSPQDSGYRVIRTIHLGGEGGWDYVTVDPDARRLYVPRSTHVMVLDEESGKVIGDIQNLRGLHGAAVAP